MAAPNYPLSALYVGDNLEVMRGMNSETVNLIATDPPFNKGVRAFSARDGTASDGASFIDKWEWRDVHADWVEQIRENWTAVHAVIEAAKLAHGYDTAAYLCWLGIRLMECHRILTEDGSIYVHLDDTASAWVKAMMDGIFGRENFRNEILWRRVLGGKSDAGVYGRQTDRLMFYTKSDAFTFTPPRFKEYNEQTVAKWFRYKDEKGTYSKQKITAAGSTQGDSGQPWRGLKPAGHWVVPQLLTERYENEVGHLLTGTVRERLDVLADAGYIEFTEKSASWRRYLHEVTIPRIHDAWFDDEVKPLARLTAERMGWPTQKPVALYERIILASSNEGDVVFDPFAGCSTTLVAAEKHGRYWVGCDRDPTARKVVLQRLSDSRQLTNTDEVAILDKPPVRTDDGPDAAPDLVLQPVKPREPTMPRSEMLERLILRDGLVCQGCGWGGQGLPPLKFRRLLQIDHRQPRSEGGPNHIDNRVLLCGDCNLTKSDTMTLKGVRQFNKKNGLMVNERGLG